MGRLRTALQAERGSECPEESEWPQVAAGMMQGREAEALLRHATACDHCGPLLRRYTEDFSEELTAEEEAALFGFESSQARWQGRMAAKLCNPRRSGIGAWLREHLLPVSGTPGWAYGAGLATRMHHNKPPTILDVPINAKWAAVGLPDPTNPVGAKGIGEPSTVAAAGAVLNALADAVGDDIIRRTPVQPEQIAAALANGRKTMMPKPLQAFI